MGRWEIIQGGFDNNQIEGLFDHLNIEYKPYNSFRTKGVKEPEDRKESIVKLDDCFFTGYKQVAEYILFATFQFNKVE